MTENNNSFWFQDTDRWVHFCSEVFRLANNVALPVLSAAAEKEIGTPVSCMVAIDGPPQELADQLRKAANELHDLAHFFEDAASTGFENGKFRPAIRGPNILQ